MSIKAKHKVDPNFNLSSMTDIIFLLLIFFMVSSSYIQTKGVLVEKPESKTATSEPAVITISIDKNLRYYYEQELISLQEIENRLTLKKKEKENLTVSLSADKSVPIEKVISLMDIGRRHKIKVVIATK